MSKYVLCSVRMSVRCNAWSDKTKREKSLEIQQPEKSARFLEDAKDVSRAFDELQMH